MKNNKNKIIFGAVAILFVLALSIYLAISVVPNALILLTKAGGSAKVSAKNSILIGEKILANADGKDKCVIYAYALDSKGKGVANKKVRLSGLGDQNMTTDSSGKAKFELTSQIAQQYQLTASVDGTILGKTIKIIFR